MIRKLGTNSIDSTWMSQMCHGLSPVTTHFNQINLAQLPGKEVGYVNSSEFPFEAWFMICGLNSYWDAVIFLKKFF